MNERKDFAPYGIRWLTRYKDKFDCSVMIDWKIIRGQSFPIAKVMPSQRRMMPIAKTARGVAFTIPDTGDGFRDPAPCDAVIIKNSKSYLVFWVWQSGQRKEKREVLWLDIDDWLELEKDAIYADKKSVRIERIREKAFNINIFVDNFPLDTLLFANVSKLTNH
jgi:hypothetical protein